MRLEHDSMGTIEVPKRALWGAQTQRSLLNFSIGDDLIPIKLIHSLALIKQSAAKVNFELGKSNLCIIKNNKKEINLYKYKYLFTEIIKCIISCKENNITKIYVDSEESNNITHLINNIFDNFGIEASLDSSNK